MADKRFETLLCDTSEARSIHYGLRYQVYCKETGFEDPSAFFDGKEKDTHDANSAHFVVKDPNNGAYIAAMRLVYAHRGRLPLEPHCNLQPVPGRLLERTRMVEMSRLCVLESHRRHNRDRDLGLRVIDGPSGEVRKTRPNPRYPEILLNFIRATCAWSREHDVLFCYFLINRALARTLKRLNIELIQVGDSIEHRGMRTPYVVDLRMTEQRMLERLPEFKALSANASPYFRYSLLKESATEVGSDIARIG